MTCPIHSHIRQPVQRSGSRESINLSLTEAGQEDVHSNVSSGPRYNEQQLIYSIKGTRLNEHGDDGLVQSARSNYPHGIADLPDVQGELDYNHKGEKEVERN